MKTKSFLIILVLFGALNLIACQPKTISVGEMTRPANQATKEIAQEVTRNVEREIMPKPQLTATPMPLPASGSALPNDDALAALYRPNRLIIKNASLELLVEDTGTAIDQVTQVVVDNFGYILSARSWYQGTFQYATITIGVPVDRFEEAMRRLRGLSIQVLDEKASGTDVTDQYVDLESRLRNLEATEARVRSFLEQAQTVEESLRVNQTLSEITAQIEEIKGQMSYLKDRSAYSTITINLSPQVPHPTPTPTPTPVVWNPGQTFTRATKVLGSVTQKLVDATIWIGVILGPFIVPLGLIIWGVGRQSRKK